MVRKSFLLTILTFLIIGAVAAVAIFFAKGYRFSPDTGMVTGTGILSITSIPDQASVYLDGHLTTATDANIDSLVPKTYDVRIVKEGYIPWEKKIEVREGLVTEVKAALFPAIPTVYPLTFNGVYNPSLSPDGQKLVFVVPPAADQGSLTKKAGVWVWTMSERPIAFARGVEPHQIAVSNPGIDYTKASFRWSPDSSQILVTLPDRSLLLNSDSLNDPPRDITAILQPTLKSWEEDEETKELTRLEVIKDLNIRKIASDAAQIKWSPDETKFLFVEEQKQKVKFKVIDLVERKTFDLPEVFSASWLSDSRHLVLVDQEQDQTDINRISIVEFDGQNQAVIFVGNFNADAVYSWPDGSRLAIVYTLPIPTAKEPNLYGINLK